MNTTTNVLPFPLAVTLVPLREYHVDRGQGRTVAVLFRVAVDHVHHEDHGADQRKADQQPGPQIGGSL